MKSVALLALHPALLTSLSSLLLKILNANAEFTLHSHFIIKEQSNDLPVYQAASLYDKISLSL